MPRKEGEERNLAVGCRALSARDKQAEDWQFGPSSQKRREEGG